MGATEDTEFVRMLPVKLTELEVKERLHEAQQKLDESVLHGQEAERLKEERKDATARESAALQRVHELVRIAESGEETREVVCHCVYDFTGNAVRIVRGDNEAIVEERAMTAEEREEHGQMVLAGGGGEEPGAN